MRTDNNKVLHRRILLPLAIVISLVIFLMVFETISFLRYRQGLSNIPQSTPSREISVNTNDDKTIQLNYDVSHYNDLMTCLDVDIDADANCLSQPDSTNIPVKKDAPPTYKWLDGLVTCGSLIKMVYLSLVIVLAIQVNTFLCCIAGEPLTDRMFYRSEWSINCAPMLGLLGTFFSIAILLTGNNSSAVGTKLLANFFDAVMTSMVGIIFYILCFYLKIHIYSQEKNNA